MTTTELKDRYMMKIDPTYRVDICYIGLDYDVTWITNTRSAIVGFQFDPDKFVNSVKHLAPGYFAIDHIRRKSVGTVWPIWDDLARELVRRGLAKVV